MADMKIYVKRIVPMHPAVACWWRSIQACEVVTTFLPTSLTSNLSLNWQRTIRATGEY